MEFILHWKIYQEAADREKYPPAQEHGFCLLLAQNHWTTDIHMNYGHNVYWQNISRVIVWICQRRSKSAQIRRNESAQIYKYLHPSISLTQFLNSYAGVSPAFFVP